MAFWIEANRKFLTKNVALRYVSFWGELWSRFETGSSLVGYKPAPHTR